jgi:hypothetical protein
MSYVSNGCLSPRSCFPAAALIITSWARPLCVLDICALVVKPPLHTLEEEESGAKLRAVIGEIFGHNRLRS